MRCNPFLSVYLYLSVCYCIIAGNMDVKTKEQAKNQNAKNLKTNIKLKLTEQYRWLFFDINKNGL